VKGNAGHQEKNNWKKWRAEEEERHKGSLTPKTCLKIHNVQVHFTYKQCCQIFLVQHTKTGKNIPNKTNTRNVYQMAINIPTLSIPKP
jgi:hypothetical protein